jgi:hypothetical protein
MGACHDTSLANLVWLRVQSMVGAEDVLAHPELRDTARLAALRAVIAQSDVCDVPLWLRHTLVHALELPGGGILHPTAPRAMDALMDDGRLTTAAELAVWVLRHVTNHVAYKRGHDGAPAGVTHASAVILPAKQIDRLCERLITASQVAPKTDAMREQAVQCGKTHARLTAALDDCMGALTKAGVRLSMALSA